MASTTEAATPIATAAAPAARQQIDLSMFRRLPREKLAVREDEIRVTSAGNLQKYTVYAVRLLGAETDMKSIRIRATGGAIARAILLTEILKRQIPNLHQTTSCGSTVLRDVYEAFDRAAEAKKKQKQKSVSPAGETSTVEAEEEEPNKEDPTKAPEQLVQERNVSYIEITLSRYADLVDMNSAGYQEPLDPSLVTGITDEEIARDGGRRALNRRRRGAPRRSAGGRRRGPRQQRQSPTAGSGTNGGAVATAGAAPAAAPAGTASSVPASGAATTTTTKEGTNTSEGEGDNAAAGGARRRPARRPRGRVGRGANAAKTGTGPIADGSVVLGAKVEPTSGLVPVTASA